MPELETDDEIFFDVDGVEHCDEELALARLLAASVLFANERETTFEGRPQGPTVVLYVNCNDLFSWGCADAENLPYSEVGNLYKMHDADQVYGASRWCCFRRNLRPQVPVVEAMKAAGAWDHALEALPAPPPS